MFPLGHLAYPKTLDLLEIQWHLNNDDCDPNDLLQCLRDKPSFKRLQVHVVPWRLPQVFDAEVLLKTLQDECDTVQTCFDLCTQAGIELVNDLRMDWVQMTEAILPTALFKSLLARLVQRDGSAMEVEK